MAENKERLSGSAVKGKRNLLFLAVIAWALAVGWVRPSEGETKISLGGVGLETDFDFVLWSIAALLAYNLLSFWLHGPFGDGQADKRMLFLFDPIHGAGAGFEHVYQHVERAVGLGALPEGITYVDDLKDWMNRQLAEMGGIRWDASTEGNAAGVRCLWRSLSWWARFRLCLAGCRRDTSRRALLENALDVWLPVLAGTSGLFAVVISLLRFA